MHCKCQESLECWRGTLQGRRTRDRNKRASTRALSLHTVTAVSAWKAMASEEWLRWRPHSARRCVTFLHMNSCSPLPPLHTQPSSTFKIIYLDWKTWTVPAEVMKPSGSHAKQNSFDWRVCVCVCVCVLCVCARVRRGGGWGVGVGGGGGGLGELPWAN